MLPHLGVHGRAHEDRCPGGQQGGGQQVVGDAGGVGAEHPGRRRRHDDQIGALPESGVGDGIRAVPERDLGRLRAKGGEGEGADEPGGIGRQHRGDVGARVDEPPADVDSLVCGDAPRHPEHDAPSGQGARRRLVGYCSSASSPVAPSMASRR